MDYESDFYENLIETSDDKYEEINRGILIVRDFIINKELILTGGTAIDMALRLNGDKLYNDSKKRDYDVYSSDHVNDAYELSNILCKNGFNLVSCINAIHLMTMTVRIDFINVADFTYCPTNILARMPILKYHKFKIIHPHWQMIDQHSALSYPYTNPGREVIFQRWEKDMKRYDLLYKYYPIAPTMTIDTDDPKYIIHGGKRIEVRTVGREKLAKKLMIQMSTIYIHINQLENTIIAGWGAVSYSYDKKTNIITVRIPEGEPLSLATHDYKSFIDKYNIKIKEYHCEFLGKLPQYILCHSDIKDTNGNNIEIELFDIYGLLLSADKINDEYNVWICCIQWSMLYLMIKIFRSDDPRLIFTAEEWYIICRRMVMDGKIPSVIVCGDYNYSKDYLAVLNKTKESIYSLKSTRKRPTNKYPILPLCEIKERFSPSDDIIYKIDGGVINELIKYELDPYPTFNINSIKNKNKL